MLLVLIVAALLVAYVVAHYANSSGAAVPARVQTPQGATSARRPSELLTLDLLIFEFASSAESRHGFRLRIFDEAGNEVGYVVDDHPQTWLAHLLDRGVAVYERDGAKVIEIEPPWRSGRLPVEIADGAGRAIGSIVAKDRARARFTLKDASGRIAGRIELKQASDPDFDWAAVVRDTMTREAGRIAYPKDRAAANRLRGRRQPAEAPGWRGWAQRVKHNGMGPDAFFLRITGDCSPDLRLFMLASAAGIDIVDFRKRFTDNG